MRDLNAVRVLSLVLAGLPAALAAPAPAATSAVAGKRGLPYNSAALVSNLFANYPQITWAYDWSGTPAGTLPSNFEYIPLLYSDPTGNSQYISSWKANATAAIKAGTTHLLAFNEPDINNLSPKQAASAYMQYMQPFSSSTVKLGAPAVTNGGPPTGLTWLGEFLGNCTSCTIDFVPFHWYCGYNNINYFVSYVQQAQKAAGGRPLWITEFQGDDVSCNAPATDAQQSEFMDTVLPWLDSLSYVQRYAYFMATQSSSSQTFLVNQAGNGLTASGTKYATLNKVNSTTPTSLVD